MADEKLMTAEVSAGDGLTLDRQALPEAELPEHKPQLIQETSVNETADAALQSQLDVPRARYREARAFQRARDHALFLMCYSAGSCLAHAEQYPDQFDRLCRERNAKGDFRETRLVDLITQNDRGHSTVSAERRADYAAAIRWMLTSEINGGNLDMEVVIAEAGRRHGINGIAAEYRDWATERLPRRSFGVRTEKDQQAREAKKAQQAAAARAAVAGRNVRIGKHPIDLSALSDDVQQQIAEKLVPGQADDDLIDAGEEDEIEIDTDEIDLNSKDNNWLSLSDLIDYVQMQLVNVESTHNFESIVRDIGDDEQYIATFLIWKRPGCPLDIFGRTQDPDVIRRTARQLRKESGK